MVRLICFGALVSCGIFCGFCLFFSFSYLQIKDKVFVYVPAMGNIHFFSVKLGKLP